MKNYSEISNRYMQENKKRSALTILGIILATVLIFAVGTFLLSFRDSMIASERAQADYEFKIKNINSEQMDKIINNAEIKDSSIYESGDQYSISGSDKIVSLEKGNKDYFDKIYTNKILDGREPEKQGEVIVDVNVKNILKVKVGDKITLANKDGRTTNINIVGVSEQKLYISDGPLVFTGYTDSFDSSKNYNVYVNLKSSKNKQDIINKVIKDASIELKDGTLANNNELLYLTGNGASEGITSSLYKMAAFVIVVIMICTITVIYNSFNISVIERIKYFGVLKAIGATPKQIKRIILKEGAIMGVIALPLGCLIGYFSLVIGVKLFIGDSLMFMDNFKVQFYPSIIAVTVALVSLTIWISILGPARKARKVSAVEAMRNKNEIKLGKLKRRRGRLIEKIFGIEGSLAYKNIRRTPVRFIITVIALTISIIMFNVFYGFLDYAKQSVNQMYGDIFFDSQLGKVNQEGFTQNEVNEIKEKEFIKDTYEFNMQDTRMPISKDSLNKDFEEKTEFKSMNKEIDNFSILNNTSTYICGDKEIKLAEKYISEGKFDLEKLESDGIILIDGRSVTHKDGTKEIVRVTNYKVGDKIKVPKLKNYNNKNPEASDEKINEAIKNNQYYEVPIVAILEKDPLEGQFLYGDKIEFMMHKDIYTKYFGEFSPNKLFFTFNGDKEARENAVKYFDEVKDSKGYNYADIGNEMKKVEQLYGQIEFFVYCFIIIVTVISVVNIFNTISTNLLLRKKEFSTLRAIGMKENQLRKSVMLEGTLYGIIASIVGGIVSALLLGLLIKLGGGIADIKYNFAVIPFAASIVVAIAVTYLSTLVPLRRLKKLTIVEGISDDE
ncbi:MULTISPECIES: ABC transporter permease [Clostridium]|uniref:ABC transporter permease n=1 Tax=Clostridium cibarium TaxID=2762247 RepID=A0ABR8PQ96_9CLOT|nr:MULTISPECIES: ABC transporter permease [Clostridium]MBD7910351.1 ABC transporter permease [Clostridium cibarium]